jgi:hypothetical protein
MVGGHENLLGLGLVSPARKCWSSLFISPPSLLLPTGLSVLLQSVPALPRSSFACRA